MVLVVQALGLCLGTFASFSFSFSFAPSVHEVVPKSRIYGFLSSQSPFFGGGGVTTFTLAQRLDCFRLLKSRSSILPKHFQSALKITLDSVTNQHPVSCDQTRKQVPTLKAPKADEKENRKQLRALLLLKRRAWMLQKRHLHQLRMSFLEEMCPWTICFCFSGARMCFDDWS